MLPLLSWVPVATSLILGVLYLFTDDVRPAFKLIAAVVFLAAVYLQFFSLHSLSGMLLQIVLAVALAGWRKVSSPK